MLNKKIFMHKITILFSLCFFSGCYLNDGIYAYYNINLDKGIEVYTHVLSENEYEFGFMPGTNMIKKADDVNKLVYVNLKKGKDIISSYDNKINENNLIVLIIPNPCNDEDLKQGNIGDNILIANEVKSLLLDIT